MCEPLMPIVLEKLACPGTCRDRFVIYGKGGFDAMTVTRRKFTQDLGVTAGLAHYPQQALLLQRSRTGSISCAGKVKIPMMY